MFRNRSIQIGTVILTAVGLAWARPTASLAQRDSAAEMPDAEVQFADWMATYGRWTPTQAEQAGYLPTDVCVTATAAGLPASAGAMGRHFVRPDYVEDGQADADAPEIVLFDANDRVVGLEFVIPTVVDPIPSVGGVPLVVSPPDPGIDAEHLSLHVYFVGDPADRHKTFNPAVDCGAGLNDADDGRAADEATDASATAVAESGAGDPDGDDSAAAQVKPKFAPDVPAAMPAAAYPVAASAAEAVTDTTATGALTETVAAASATVAAASAPVAVDLSTMPVAGAGDWLPGGDTTLFGGLAGALVLLAAAGWWTAVRRA